MSMPSARTRAASRSSLSPVVQRQQQAVVGIDVAGPQLQGPSEMPDRFVQPAEVAQGDTQVVVSFGVVGPQPQCLAEAFRRLLWPTLAQQYVAQVVVRLRV